jgi:hypothetical protein
MNGRHVIIHVDNHRYLVGPDDVDHLGLEWVRRPLHHQHISILRDLDTDYFLSTVGQIP